MNKFGSIIYLKFFCFLLAVLFLTACAGHNTPPTIAYEQEKFESNFDDINTIIGYMIDSGYESIQITDTSGTMLADLTRVEINNSDVMDAVSRALETYIKISKNGNTIKLFQWRGIRDIGCGIAYSIDGINKPQIQFVTELIPLAEDGWFYYVSDYNKWRSMYG